MPLEGKDLDKKLNQIIMGHSRVNLGGCFFLLKELSEYDNYFLQQIYDEELNSAISSGVISESELFNILNESECWTDFDESEFIKLKKQVYDLEREIYFTEITASNKVSVNRSNIELKKLKNKLNESWNKKTSLFFGCAEYRADFISRKYIPFLSLYNLRWERVWDDVSIYKKSKDNDFIVGVLNEYNSRFMCDEISVRKIARLSEWRYRWNVSKSDIRGLFNRSIPELTEQQSLLIHWSQTYDIVYESMDRPSRKVIENDILLDKWFKEQSKKIEKTAIEKQYGMDKKTKSNKKNQSLFLMAKDEKEAQEIYSLNDSSSVFNVEKEMKQINSVSKKNIPEVG